MCDTNTDLFFQIHLLALVVGACIGVGILWLKDVISAWRKERRERREQREWEESCIRHQARLRRILNTRN